MLDTCLDGLLKEQKLRAVYRSLNNEAAVSSSPPGRLARDVGAENEGFEKEIWRFIHDI